MPRLTHRPLTSLYLIIGKFLNALSLPCKQKTLRPEFVVAHKSPS